MAPRLIDVGCREDVFVDSLAILSKSYVAREWESRKYELELRIWARRWNRVSGGDFSHSGYITCIGINQHGVYAVQLSDQQEGEMRHSGHFSEKSRTFQIHRD